MNILEEIAYYLSFDFVKYALIVGTLISLACAILGVTLVLKKYAMIGDGLSHVAFGALSLAMVLTIADLYLTMPLTIIVAILLIRLSTKSKVKSDSAIAMLSVGSLAFGYFILNLFSTSANISGDVCTTLFGSISILTLTQVEVWVSIILTILVLAFFIIFHNKIFAVTFDENFSKATGIQTNKYNNVLAFIIGIVIVLAMKLVGALLISALVVFPAISAIRICKSYKMVIIFACIIGVINSVVGILLAILIGTPVGATIVIIDILAYFCCWALENIIKKSKAA